MSVIWRNKQKGECVRVTYAEGGQRHEEHLARARAGDLLRAPRHTIFSSALGIHPNQIAEATRRFPDHEYTPDGRMVVKNLQHQKKVCRELGFVDLDGNWSGRN